LKRISLGVPGEIIILRLWARFWSYWKAQANYPNNLKLIGCQVNLKGFGNVILNQIGYLYGDKMMKEKL